MILHIPHSSTRLPDGFTLADGNDLDTELHRLTDWYTDDLFTHPNADRVVFNYSRLFCDVERFRNDAVEPMAAKGMGVCYTNNSFGGKLRDVSDEEAEHIKSEYYDKHHTRLTDSVSEQLSIFESVMIVDCHSFSNDQLPHEHSHKRPHFCIGTDDFHTPPELVKEVKDFLEERGFFVLVNEPFAGTIVPTKYYLKQPSVKSIMIEVNRNLYCFKNGKHPDFERVQSTLTDVLEIINSYEVV